MLWLLAYSARIQRSDTCRAPGGIQQDLMHPAHADVDRVQHHADCFIHQSPQAKFGRDQVSLVPVRFPDNLQDT